MADVMFRDFLAGLPVDVIGGAEKIPVLDTTSKHITPDLVKTFVLAALTASAAITPTTGDALLVERAGAEGTFDLDSLVDYVAGLLWTDPAEATPALTGDMLLLDRGGLKYTVDVDTLVTYVNTSNGTLGAQLTALSAATLADTDEYLLSQGGTPLKVTFANLSARVQAQFNTYLAALSAVVTPADADTIYVLQGTTAKKLTLTTLANTYLAAELDVEDFAWNMSATDPLNTDNLLIDRAGVRYKVDIDTMTTFFGIGIQSDILDFSALSSATPNAADRFVVDDAGVEKQLTLANLAVDLWTRYNAYVAALPAVTTVAGSDKLYCIQGGTSKYVTPVELAKYMEVLPIASIAALKTLTKASLTNGVSRQTLGYLAASPGYGAAIYKWDSTSSATVDNVIYHDSDEGTTGRWILQHDGLISLSQAGADPTGVANCRTAMKAIADAGFDCIVTKGSYFYSGTTAINVADFRLLDGGGSITMDDAVASRINIHGARNIIDGVTLVGTMEEQQYIKAIDGVAAYFAAPTYEQGDDTPYAGSDFIHTLSVNELTIGLDALTGTQTREVVSSAITLDDAKRYVVDVADGFIVSGLCFTGIEFRYYDSVDTMVGVWDPVANGIGSVSQWLKDAEYVRIVLGVHRNTIEPVGSETVLDLSKIRFFELTNSSATVAESSTGAVSQYGIQIGPNAIGTKVINCKASRFLKSFVLVPSGGVEDLEIRNNKVTFTVQGLEISDLTRGVIADNEIDGRFKDDSGELIDLKWLRTRGISGVRCDKTRINNNDIRGYSWAVEIIDDSHNLLISRNDIDAGLTGLSIMGDDNRIVGNEILIGGLGSRGIEAPYSYRADIAYNNIKSKGMISGVGIPVNDITAGDGKASQVKSNTIEMPIGIQVVGTETDGDTEIEENTIFYSMQGISARVCGNVIRKNTLKPARYGGNRTWLSLPPAGLYSAPTGTAGQNALTFNSIVDNHIEAAGSYAVYVNFNNTLTFSDNELIDEYGADRVTYFATKTATYVTTHYLNNNRLRTTNASALGYYYPTAVAAGSKIYFESNTRNGKKALLEHVSLTGASIRLDDTSRHRVTASGTTVTINAFDYESFSFAGGSISIVAAGTWYVGVDLFRNVAIALPRLGHRGWIPVAKVVSDGTDITAINDITLKIPDCRIPRTMKKILAGETIKVKVMGSSLSASSGTNSWAGMLFSGGVTTDYKIPGTVTFVNYGLGGATNKFQFAQTATSLRHFGTNFSQAGWPKNVNTTAPPLGRSGLLADTDLVVIGILANSGDYRLECLEPIIRNLRKMGVEVLIQTDNPQGNPFASYAALLASDLYVDGPVLRGIADKYNCEFADTAAYVADAVLRYPGDGNIYASGDSIHMAAVVPAGRTATPSGGHEVWARAVRSVFPVDGSAVATNSNQVYSEQTLPKSRVVTDKKTPGDAYVILPYNEGNLVEVRTGRGTLGAHPLGADSFARRFSSLVGASQDLLTLTTGEDANIACNGMVGAELIYYSEIGDAGFTIEVYKNNTLVDTIVKASGTLTREIILTLWAPVQYAQASPNPLAESIEVRCTAGTIKIAALVALTTEHTYVSPGEINYVGTWAGLVDGSTTTPMPGYATDTINDYAFYRCPKEARKVSFICTSTTNSKIVDFWSVNSENLGVSMTGSSQVKVKGDHVAPGENHYIRLTEAGVGGSGAAGNGYGLHIGGAIITYDRA